MEVLLAVGLLLLSPALLAASILFPFYWIGQYRLLRRTGSWVLHRERHELWRGWMWKAALTSYVLCLGGLLLPGIFPMVRSFLRNGGLLGIVPFAVLDFAVLGAFSPDRAFALWKADQVSGPRGGGARPGG